ncbi:unnamed protein product, partial [Polarella glacialis]
DSFRPPTAKAASRAPVPPWARARDSTQDDEVEDIFEEEAEEEGFVEEQDDDMPPDDMFEEQGEEPVDVAPQKGYGRGGKGTKDGKGSKGKGKGKGQQPPWARERPSLSGWKEKREPEVREPLPIQQKRAEVVPILCGEANVVCILGETGSGKSTQVPQLILEEARKANQHCRIAVSQPRRVAALNLANRVAQELGEDGTGTTVGYRIGGDTVVGEHIDFCTTGYLLQLFLNAPE